MFVFKWEGFIASCDQAFVRLFGSITKLSFLYSLLMFNTGLRTDFINTGEIPLNLLKSLQIHSVHNSAFQTRAGRPYRCLHVQLCALITRRTTKLKILNVRLRLKHFIFSCYASNMCRSFRQTYFFQQPCFCPVGFANIISFFSSNSNISFCLKTAAKKKLLSRDKQFLRLVVLLGLTFHLICNELFFSRSRHKERKT